MPISIQTNTVATRMAQQFNKEAAEAARSVKSLSSGSRLVNPRDDAGGFSREYEAECHAARDEFTLNAD